MQNAVRDEDKTKKQLLAELVGLRRHVGRLTSIYEDLDASAYTVAHDLKRSLSLILGFSELLLREYDWVISSNASRLDLVRRIGGRRYSASALD
jgi:signal transduction histidine kinase